MKSINLLFALVLAFVISAQLSPAQCITGTTIRNHTRLTDATNGCTACTAPGVLLHLLHSVQPTIMLTYNGAVTSNYCTTGINGTLSMYETAGTRYSVLEGEHDFSLVSGVEAGHLVLSTRNYGKWIKFATTPTTGAADLERMCIKANGDVGIGVTAPDSRLQIKSAGDDGTTTALKVSNVWGNVLAVIQDGGRMGVYQATPKERLHIGDLMTFHDGGSKFMGFNAYYDAVATITKNITAGKPSVTIGIGDGTNDPGLFFIQVDRNGSVGQVFDFSSSPWQGMVINTNGLMGVGTMDPKSTLHVLGDVVIGVDACTSSVSSGINNRLSVDGAIFAKEIWVKVTDWADYVFDPSYNLMPLSELQDFVTANRHLPGVLQEEDAIKDGISISEVQKNLLLKVEELTLYLLQLSKQNERLQQEIATIKLLLDDQSSK